MEGTTGDPQRTATANVQDSRQQSSHGSSGRSRHSRSARKILKQKLIILGLSLALFIALLGWLFTAIRLSSVSDEYHDYRVSSRDELDQRKQNNVELDQLRSEREALVKGLIPGLHPLNFDETNFLLKPGLLIRFSATGRVMTIRLMRALNFGSPIRIMNTVFWLWINLEAYRFLIILLT